LRLWSNNINNYYWRAISNKISSLIDTKEIALTDIHELDIESLDDEKIYKNSSSLDRAIFASVKITNRINQYSSSYINSVFTAALNNPNSNYEDFKNILKTKFRVSSYDLANLEANISFTDENQLKSLIEMRALQLYPSKSILNNSSCPWCPHARAPDCNCGIMVWDFFVEVAFTGISCGSCANGIIPACAACARGLYKSYKKGKAAAKCGCFS